MAQNNMKIQPPVKLPSTGLTPDTLENWRFQLIVYLKQNPDYRRFLAPKGIYKIWTAGVRDKDRIKELHATDKVDPNLEDAEEQNAARLLTEEWIWKHF